MISYNYIIINLVFFFFVEAVRKINLYKNTPEQDIVKPIKLHLAQAKFRLEKKQQKQINNNI